jgi:zinc and cadmium transporter
VAAAAHEIPQELGDFGVLLHGGWPPRRALMWNFLSALTFPVGALVAYGTAHVLAVTGLVAFAAGNFVYISATDLIPQLTVTEDWRQKSVHTLALLVGLGILLGIAARG